jgi:hypothetical protein
MPSGSSTSCDIPSGLNATNVTETEATLNWSAVAGAMSYNIKYRAVGSPSWVNTTSSSNSSILTGLFGAVDYEFQVQTICSSGQSTFSASGTFTTLSTINTPCKVCSYQPWCDGTIYNYIDTTDGVPATASETIAILGTTMINGTMYDITQTQAGDTVYHNCDSINQITKLILNIDPLGTGPVQVTSTLIKSNLGVAPWSDSYMISGYTINVNYSLVGSFASRTVLGIPYNDVIQIHQVVSAVISPLLPATTVSVVDYYYAAGIGLIEQITNDTYPGSAPSNTHRVLETYFIP